MAISYQVLILHDSGTTGPGKVISAGNADMTQDGKFDVSTCTVRTDSPNPSFVFSDSEKLQYHEWDGVSAYVLTDKPYDIETESTNWNGDDYYTDTIAVSLGGQTREFIASSIPSNGIVKLIGDFENVTSGQTSDFTNTRSYGNKRFRLIVNSITTGGDVIITGTSINSKTGLKTTSDTETITIDTTVSQTYVTDKSWTEIDNIDVDTNTTGINYDAGIDGSDTFFGTNFRITGYKFDALSNGATSDFRLRIRKYSRTIGKKRTLVELEDIGIDSTGGNGTEVDGLRTGIDDRSYTYSATAFPDDRQQGLMQNDFDTYFTSDENIVYGSKEEGLLVQVRGQGQSAMTNIESFRFTLKYQTIV